MTQANCIAMLLAGGEGKRLAPLTHKLAKPAVPFGGHYRIIDFPLSNCVNSGIHNIGVLTQYKAESLHSHIGDGRHWTKEDTSGIELLPADLQPGGSYLGTADAIYKNIAYIEKHNPEHVLILSGDHIYQMDYEAMLKNHQESGAEATIAVKSVPWKDAHRFGILNTDSSLKVTDFIEKPAKPESNLASMGIYLFKWSFLKRYLIKDADNLVSNHDFGKDLIPQMLINKANVFAYAFEGYWRDVGTVESLWEAHMDVLDGEIGLDVAEWPMFTNERENRSTSFLHPLADIQQSLVNPHSAVEGDLERSVVFSGVHIGRGSEIKESILMPNVKIGQNVQIYKAILGEGTIVEDGAVIGHPDGEVTVIGADELVFARSSYMAKTDQLLNKMYDNEGAMKSEGLKL
jgi:glucose-1-phosphate adenylyltransferase